MNKQQQQQHNEREAAAYKEWNEYGRYFANMGSSLIGGQCALKKGRERASLDGLDSRRYMQERPFLRPVDNGDGAVYAFKRAAKQRRAS